MRIIEERELLRGLTSNEEFRKRRQRMILKSKTNNIATADLSTAILLRAVLSKTTTASAFSASLLSVRREL